MTALTAAKKKYYSFLVNARFLLPLLFTAFGLCGCTDLWLVGKWRIDKDATLAAFSGTGDKGEKEGLLGDILDGVQKGVSRVLLTQLEGTIIEFTAKEVRHIENGTGNSQTYEVIERPGNGTAVLKYESGEIVTWGRTTSGVRRKLPGDQELWIHFKAAK